MTAPSISYVTILGIRTAQITAGEGEPVLMLHGWGANRDLVWPLAERLVRMGYRVFVPDMPGFGQSGAPPIPWSVYDYANFVLAYMDHHHLEKVNLFGHSFGGRLGLILGAEHPERISKIALANSAGVRSRASLPVRARLALYKTIRSGLNAFGLRAIAGQLSGWYANRYGSADYLNSSGVMRETFVQVVNEDLLPCAERVQLPTFLFWGDQDDETPLWQGQLLEQTIPDAALHVYKGAGHYSYLDHLDETARIMDVLFKSG